MLQVNDIHTYYGLSHVLFGVSLEVKAGEVVCLLGRNGAGKSTTMRSIIGLTPPARGQIVFKKTTCTAAKPFRMVQMGMGYVPDDRRVFADLTVAENLEIAFRKTKDGTWTMERVYQVFPALEKIAGRRAGFLSGGEQQMLTIARALMTNPDFLLLDEPTEGLAPIIVAELEKQIAGLRDTGLTVLLAEQNLEVALRLSDRCYIIENGSIRYQGTSSELRSNPAILDKYLCV